MKRGKPCTGNKESRKLESTVFVVVRGVPKSPTQVSTHAYTSEHTRVITKRLGHLMIVRLRGRVCGHLDCTLSGWLGSREPSFLPSFLPSFPASLLCLRLLPASRCSRPRVCAQAGTGDQQGLHSGWGSRDSSLVQRAHCAPCAVLAGAPACRGRPPHHPAGCGAPGSSRDPRGLRTWGQSPSGGPGASWSRPRM